MTSFLTLEISFRFRRPLCTNNCDCVECRLRDTDTAASSHPQCFCDYCTPPSCKGTANVAVYVYVLLLLLLLVCMYIDVWADCHQLLLEIFKALATHANVVATAPGSLYSAVFCYFRRLVALLACCCWRALKCKKCP